MLTTAPTCKRGRGAGVEMTTARGKSKGERRAAVSYALGQKVCIIVMCGKMVFMNHTQYLAAVPPTETRAKTCARAACAPQFPSCVCVRAQVLGSSSPLPRTAVARAGRWCVAAPAWRVGAAAPARARRRPPSLVGSRRRARLARGWRASTRRPARAPSSRRRSATMTTCSSWC